MAGPTNLEQLLLQYVNEARLDPMGNAARYIAAYSPLTSNDRQIQFNLTYFGVDGPTLLNFNLLHLPLHSRWLGTRTLLAERDLTTRP